MCTRYLHFLNMAASDKTNPQTNTEQFPGIIRNFDSINFKGGVYFLKNVYFI